MAEKTKIFGIGISGLVGTRLAEILHNKYTFTNLSSDTGIDITDVSTLDVIRRDQEHAIVLHLAAKADVDACEKDKAQGVEGAAYKVNVAGTQNVVDICRDAGKKMIYISTDFVFDGENTPEGGYSEEDTPHPINWYAETKYKGEEIVKQAGIDFLIMRIAYPYQKKEFALKKDFIHAIVGRLKNKQPIAAITDHVMTPLLIDDMAYALDALIEQKQRGIFHVVGSEFITPYDAALKIADAFGLDKSLISKTTRAEYFKDRAPRPFNLALNNDKIKKLGISMKTFQEGLKEVI